VFPFRIFNLRCELHIDMIQFSQSTGNLPPYCIFPSLHDDPESDHAQPSSISDRSDTLHVMRNSLLAENDIPLGKVPFSSPQLHQRKIVYHSMIDDHLKILDGLAKKHRLDWKKVCQSYNKLYQTKFSPDTLRNNYRLHVPPNVKKVRFTKDEDRKLAQLAKKFNLRWGDIAKSFPDRDPIALKNRYYSWLKKKRWYQRDILNVEAETMEEDNEEIIKQGKNLEEEEKKEKTNLDEDRRPANVELTIKVGDIVLDHIPEWLRVIDGLIKQIMTQEGK